MSTVSKRKKAETRQQSHESCPGHLIDELVAQGFKREAVEGWAAERARRVLEKRARKLSHEAARANADARRIDGARFPPPQPLRLDAAGAISAAIGGTDELELIAAMEAGMHCLAAGELSRMATRLILTLKEVPELPAGGRTPTSERPNSAVPTVKAKTAADTSQEL